MDMMGKWMLKENKTPNPRFSLTYRRSVSEKISKKVSYEIISRFTQEHDLLIEVNSAYFSGVISKEKENVIPELVRNLRELNIDYRLRKNNYPKQKSFLEFFVAGDKTVTEDELSMLVPNASWKQEDFWEIIPPYGVKYSVLNAGVDGAKLLDDLHLGRVLETEKINSCQTVIFDCFYFGQMGIDTELTKTEVEVILGK